MRAVKVRSFGEAQLLVPFPVHTSPGETGEISVRPETAMRWATVRSLHRVSGQLVRVKQYAFDWFGFFGTPNKLLFTHSDRRQWGLYGPTTRLELGHRPAFHGMDFSGCEAGALASLMVNIEARVLRGRMGTSQMARFLSQIVPVHPRYARLLAVRPLCLWSWMLRAGRTPNSRLSPIETDLRWYGDPGLGIAAWPKKLRLPRLSGWRFDSIGVHRASARHPSLCHVLYRSFDLHTTLEVGLESGVRRRAQPFREPCPPLFKEEVASVVGRPTRYFRSETLGSAWVILSDGSDRLTIVIPPTRAQRNRDLSIAAALVHGLID